MRKVRLAGVSYILYIMKILAGDVVEKEGTKKAGVEASGRRRKRVKRLKSRMYTTDDGAMGETVTSHYCLLLCCSYRESVGE